MIEAIDETKIQAFWDEFLTWLEPEEIVSLQKNIFINLKRMITEGRRITRTSAEGSQEITIIETSVEDLIRIYDFLLRLEKYFLVG